MERITTEVLIDRLAELGHRVRRPLRLSGLAIQPGGVGPPAPGKGQSCASRRGMSSAPMA